MILLSIWSSCFLTFYFEHTVENTVSVSTESSVSRHGVVSVQNNKSFCDHPVCVPLPLVTGQLINMKGGTDNKAGNSNAASAPRPQRLC